MRGWQVRQVANWLNLSTPLGLLVALLGRTRVRRGPRGLILAAGYRLRVPPNPAFTVGDVVLTRRDVATLLSDERLLRHEERHAWQYAACLGLPFLPAYAVGAGWSWLRGGDPGVHNPLERLAGLADGGYPLVSARERRRRTPTGPAVP